MLWLILLHQHGFIMNEESIPITFRWIVPIMEELERQADSENEIALSDAARVALDNNLTHECLKEIEEWMHLEAGEWYGIFLEGTLLLDELGYLDKVTPPLDFNYSKCELTSKVWGNVRNSAQIIAVDHLEELGDDAKAELDIFVLDLLRTQKNPNGPIWLRWLRCQLNHELDEGRDHLLDVIKTETPKDDEEYDLTTDACEALLTLPQVKESDIEVVLEFIFGTETDESDAVVVLGDLLSSQYVPAATKQRAIERVRTSGSEDLLEVVEEIAE